MCQLSERPRSRSLLYVKSEQQWLDMKVFYIRLSAAVIKRGAHIPESLTVHYLPRNSQTALEMNGRRIHPSSSAFLILERSRADEKSDADIAYVGTDSVSTRDNLCFEVFMRDELLISGTLEKKKQQMDDLIWSVECSCKLESSSKWPFQSMSAPTLDVYLAGRMSGLPLILTQTVQMIPRRKRVRRATLDVIHEGNENENEEDDTECSDSSDDEYSSVNSFCNGFDVNEDDDSWFNSRFGFGLGIGLGMLGMGLLVNSSHMRKRIP